MADKKVSMGKDYYISEGQRHVGFFHNNQMSAIYSCHVCIGYMELLEECQHEDES